MTLIIREIYILTDVPHYVYRVLSCTPAAGLLIKTFNLMRDYRKDGLSERRD